MFATSTTFLRKGLENSFAHQLVHVSPSRKQQQQLCRATSPRQSILKAEETAWRANVSAKPAGKTLRNDFAKPHLHDSSEGKLEKHLRQKRPNARAWETALRSNSCMTVLHTSLANSAAKQHAFCMKVLCKTCRSSFASSFCMTLLCKSGGNRRRGICKEHGEQLLKTLLAQWSYAKAQETYLQSGFLRKTPMPKLTKQICKATSTWWSHAKA